MLSALLTTGSDGKWHPGIGDPTVVGWLTVVAYAVAAYFAYRAYRNCTAHTHVLAAQAPTEAHAQRLLASLWLLVLVAMVLLGLNKQLDLQTLFTQTMRVVFFKLELYEQRRKFQVAFIGAIAVGAVATVAGLTYLFWSVLRRAIGAVVGLAVVVSFVVIRAASFHHVDLYLKSGPFPLNLVLELGGVIVLAIAGYRASHDGAGSGSDIRVARS